MGVPTGHGAGSPPASVDTQESAARARAIVMNVERGLGFEPVDREVEKLGYDIESHVPTSGKLRFLEVKGRISGAPTINVTRNEILYSLNKPEDFILAIVEFDGDSHRVHYVRTPFQREPDFGVTSVNYDFAELLARAQSRHGDARPENGARRVDYTVKDNAGSMTPYSDLELERMLSDVESDLTERKESFAGDAPIKAREAVCAFANDLPNHRRPGVLFVGARDDGSSAGLAVTDELLLQLADMKTDGNIVPPPTLHLRSSTRDGSTFGLALAAALRRSRTSGS